MMNKKFFTYCCLFLALISCKRQVVIQHDSMVVLHAAYAQTPTKVGLDSDLKTIWTDGDRVSVFYAGATENSNAVFTGKTGSRSESRSKALTTVVVEPISATSTSTFM